MHSLVQLLNILELEELHDRQEVENSPLQVELRNLNEKIKTSYNDRQKKHIVQKGHHQ